MIKKFLHLTISLILLGATAEAFAQTASATVPQILLTWSANTYAPAGFEGKIMPTANSLITASAELIDGGRIVDVSKQNVYWYLNNTFVAGGPGVRDVSFAAPDAVGGGADLRVEFPDYSKGSQLKTVSIPIVKPVAVIEAPFPNGNFSSSPVKLAARPYFFNTNTISNLNLAWNVNGQTPTGAENPQNLNVTLGQNLSSGAVLSVSLSVTNALNQFEAAFKSVSLIYAP